MTNKINLFFFSKSREHTAYALRSPKISREHTRMPAYHCHYNTGVSTRFPGTYVPRYLCSPVPMFPEPMFPGTDVPRYLAMFPGTYVPRNLCSPVGLPMFPGTYVPRTYVPRYLCSPNLCSPVPMFPDLLQIC